MQQMQNQYQPPVGYVHPYGQQYVQLPRRIMPWAENRHGPLVLPPFLHPIPDNYLKLLPRYNSEKKIKADEYLDAFQN